MAKRVYEVASELGMSSKVLLKELKEMGFDVTAAMSGLSDEEVARVVAAYRAAGTPGPGEAAGEPETDAGTSPASRETGSADGSVQAHAFGVGKASTRPAPKASEKAAAAPEKPARVLAFEAEVASIMADESVIDKEKAITALVRDGVQVAAGKVYRLTRRGSVSAGNVRVQKRGIIRAEVYAALPRRVKAYFDEEDA